MAERAAIDWASARARIDAAIERAHSSVRPVEEIERELERRARQLAAPPVERPRTLDAGRLRVAFSVSGERYAVPADRVQDVVALPAVLHVPGLPDLWRGVVLHRGRVVPVLDIGALLGRSPAEITPSHRMIVVDAKGMGFGLLADAVDGCRVDEAASAAESETDRRFITEVAEDGVGVLDLDALAEDPRLTVNQEE